MVRPLVAPCTPLCTNLYRWKSPVACRQVECGFLLMSDQYMAGIGGIIPWIVDQTAFNHFVIWQAIVYDNIRTSVACCQCSAKEYKSEDIAYEYPHSTSELISVSILSLYTLLSWRSHSISAAFS